MNTSTPSHLYIYLGLFWAGVIGILAGCVAGEPAATAPRETPVAAVSGDNLVYYPAYEVYYDPHLRLYWYRQAGVWLTAPTPADVALNVLQASPSVLMDFQGSPIDHHFRVMQQYPRDWPHAQT